MRRHGRLGTILLESLGLLLFLYCTGALGNIVAGPGPYFLDDEGRVRAALTHSGNESLVSRKRLSHTVSKNLCVSLKPMMPPTLIR